MDGTGEFFDSFAAYLEGFFEISIISYPRHEPLSYDELSEYVLSKIPSGSFSLLGESFSGPIAMRIAAKLPDRVTSLILVATFARAPVPRPLIMLVAQLPLEWIPTAVIDWLLMGRFRTPALSKKLQNVLKTVTPEVLKLRMTEMIEINERKNLAELICPVFCIFGHADYHVGIRASNYILKFLKNGNASALDAPHMILQVRPEESAKLVKAFALGMPTPPTFPQHRS